MCTCFELSEELLLSSSFGGLGIPQTLHVSLMIESSCRALTKGGPYSGHKKSFIFDFGLYQKPVRVLPSVSDNGLNLFLDYRGFVMQLAPWHGVWT